MPSSHKIVIWLLASGLIALLSTSIYQRFKNPDIIYHTSSNNNIDKMQSDSGMDHIGPLMQAVAQNPGNQKMILDLTEALIAINQWEPAENFARKALALNNPDNPEPRALYFMAVIHHKKGEYAEAAQLLEQLLQEHENPSARFNLGVLYFYYLNKPDKASAHLQKGIDFSGTPDSLKKAMEEELNKITGQFHK